MDACKLNDVRVSVWVVAMALWATLLMGGTAAAVNLDQEVSLDVSNRTLDAALEKLTRQTGYQFDLDDQWRDHPVTLKVDNISLQECLQRLLESFNYAIVSQPDRHIALTIFGEQTAARALPAPRAPLRRSNRVTQPVTPPDDEPDEADEPDEEEEPDEEDEEEDIEEGEDETNENAQDEADEQGEEGEEEDDEESEGDASKSKKPEKALKIDINE